MNVLVSVNVDDACAATAAENIVMFPQSLLRVTPVVRLLPWVTVPPAPVA
jgi:hypothetical protein